VVGHQTIGEQTDRRPLAGFVKKFQEGQVITILVKHGAARVATVQDVVAIAALRSSTGAWHVGIIGEDKTASSEKVECLLFSGIAFQPAKSYSLLHHRGADIVVAKHPH